MQLLQAWYDGCIYYLDQKVEELFNELRKHGLDSNTIFIVLSDHGENIGELIQRKIELIEKFRHVEPKINDQINWRV